MSIKNLIFGIVFHQKIEFMVSLFNYSIKRTKKDLRFPSTYNLTNLPTTISGLLTEDRRLLGQNKKDYLLFSRWQSISNHFNAPQFPQEDREGTRQHSCTQHIALQWRNPKLSGLQPSKMSCKYISPLVQIETFILLRSKQASLCFKGNTISVFP